MACIKTVEDVRQLGTILGIWAHPDDETYAMAGIMAAAVQNGQKVIMLFATRGEAGVQDATRWPTEKLAQIRTQESDEALRILGVHTKFWLDYPDGGCKNLPDEKAITTISHYIKLHNPNSIFTFGPDGLTGHDDHKTVSKWATLSHKKANSEATIYHCIQTTEQYEAMKEADKQFNVYFNIPEPPIEKPAKCAIHFLLPDDLYDMKFAALKAMPSQTEGILAMFGHQLHAGLGTEAFVYA